MLKKLLELIPKEHEKLYQEAAKQAEREGLLSTIIESIRNTLDVNEIRQNLVNVVGEKFKADKCFFWDYDNDKKEFIQQLKFDYVTSPEYKKPYTYGKETDEFLIETYKKQGYIFIPDFLDLVEDTGHLGVIGRHQINYHNMRTNCCFGLFDGEKFLGAFAVQYKNVTQISNEDIEFLKRIVNQASIALKQAELYLKTKKQNKREQIIREITETALIGFDLKEIQNKLVMKVVELFEPDKCFIRPFNNEIDAFTLVEEHAQYCSSPNLKKQYCFSEEVEELIKKEYKRGNAFIVPNFEEFFKKPEPFCYIAKRQIEHYGIRANYCFPIIAENKLIGAFVVQFEKTTHLEPEDINLLKTVVNQAAISLTQAEQHQKLQKQIKREVFLRKINEAISETLDSDRILNLVCQEMITFFDTDRVAIGQYNPNEESLKSIKVTEATVSQDIPCHKNATLSAKVNEYLSKNLLKKGEDLIINNLEDENIPKFYRDFHKQLGTKSILNVAIKKGEENWGIMALFYNRDFRTWTSDEIDLMHAISEQVFIAIRQAELFIQSQKASKAKSEFLSIMSHEIRTPLAGVSGFLQLLAETDLSDKQRKYIDYIKTSSESLLNIIGGVLDFSKIEAEKIEIEKNKFNLHTLVNDSILNARASGYKKGLDINAHINPNVPINVIGDSGKLRQVLNNLFNNSIKFTNAGRILLTVKSLTKENNNENIYFEVADTGIGISKENIKKVFQPFVQANNLKGRRYGGTGLGLTICERLVRLMGGNLAIESEVDKGTKTSFNIKFDSAFDIEKKLLCERV